MNLLAVLVAQRLRRDWMQLVLWFACTVALAFAGFAGVAQSFGAEQDRIGILAAVMANPVILLFRGLPSGTDESAFIVFLMLPFLAMMAAFMSTFLAVRHTRGDEEAGRLEFVAATPAGRWLPTAATIVHGALANIVLGALLAVSFLAAGAALEGSLLVGAATAATGLVFLGSGLLAAQLMHTSRGANSLTVWMLVVSFVIAGMGNAIGRPADDLTHLQSSWLTWLSPFGWAENTRAFDENLWWPALLSLGVCTALTAVALALQTGRDTGSSIVPERLGRVTARAGLSSSTALVARLAAPSMVGWVIGALIAGVMSTTLGSIIDRVGADNPAITNVLSSIVSAGDVRQSVIVVFFLMIGLFAACAAVQTIARARQEETRGTAEAVLAAPVDRLRWLAGFLLVGVAGVIVTCAAGFAGAAAGALSGDSAAELVRTAAVAAGGQVVGASVFLALTALVFTLAPRLTIPVGWSLVVIGITVGLFGPLLGLPEALSNLSPFIATPELDGDALDPRGLWWLVLIAAAGAGAALTLMRRRELASER